MWEGIGGVYVDFLDLRMFGDAGTISLGSGGIFQWRPQDLLADPTRIRRANQQSLISSHVQARL
jgi:hypothetical protein